MATERAPARRRAMAADWALDPVVQVSSISRTRAPGRTAGREPVRVEIPGLRRRLVVPLAPPTARSGTGRSGRAADAGPAGRGRSGPRRAESGRRRRPLARRTARGRAGTRAVTRAAFVAGPALAAAGSLADLYCHSCLACGLPLTANATGTTTSARLPVGALAMQVALEAQRTALAWRSVADQAESRPRAAWPRGRRRYGRPRRAQQRLLRPHQGPQPRPAGLPRRLRHLVQHSVTVGKASDNLPGLHPHRRRRPAATG